MGNKNHNSAPGVVCDYQNPCCIRDLRGEKYYYDEANGTVALFP